MNRDFVEMLSALCDAEAEFLIVGAHAMAVYGRRLQMGLPPARIDLLTSILGVEFEAAWAGRVPLRLGDLEVMVIGREELIKNKRAVGRPRDVADVAELEGG